MSWWIGIAWGIGVMGGHTLLRVLTHQWALRQSDGHGFLVLELSGLGARMALVLGAVAAVLGLVPVDEVSFVGTVLSLVVLSIIFEVRFIVRQLDRDALGDERLG